MRTELWDVSDVGLVVSLICCELEVVTVPVDENEAEGGISEQCVKHTYNIDKTKYKRRINAIPTTRVPEIKTTPRQVYQSRTKSKSNQTYNCDSPRQNPC